MVCGGGGFVIEELIEKHTKIFTGSLKVGELDCGHSSQHFLGFTTATFRFPSTP